jgi:hypothetical protein
MSNSTILYKSLHSNYIKIIHPQSITSDMVITALIAYKDEIFVESDLYSYLPNDLSTKSKHEIISLLLHDRLIKDL